MELEQLIPDEEVLEEDLRDPEFRRRWEETALARWLALIVSQYRAEHELSQRALAGRLGMHQSAIARLEDGEHTPTLPTLVRISQTLGIELLIDIKPPHTESQLAKARARNEGQTLPVGDGEVLVAAG